MNSLELLNSIIARARVIEFSNFTNSNVKNTRVSVMLTCGLLKTMNMSFNIGVFLSEVSPRHEEEIIKSAEPPLFAGSVGHHPKSLTFY